MKSKRHRNQQPASNVENSPVFRQLNRPLGATRRTTTLQPCPAPVFSGRVGSTSPNPHCRAWWLRFSSAACRLGRPGQRALADWGPNFVPKNWRRYVDGLPTSHGVYPQDISNSQVPVFFPWKSDQSSNVMSCHVSGQTFKRDIMSCSCHVGNHIFAWSDLKPCHVNHVTKHTFRCDDVMLAATCSNNLKSQCHATLDGNISKRNISGDSWV